MSDLVKVSLDLSGVVAQALYFSTTIPERIRPTTIVNSNTGFYDSLPGLLNDSNKVRVSATIASNEDQSNFFSTTITERIRPSVIALDNLQEYSVYNTNFELTDTNIQVAVDNWCLSNGDTSTYNNINISNWDTSLVTNMSNLFKDKTNFNDDISNWNTSAVINMENMFNSADSFSQDLTNFDTSQVTNMKYMFANCKQDIGGINNFNLTSITEIDGMFQSYETLNYNIKEFVSKVRFNTSMTNTFFDIHKTATDTSLHDISKYYSNILSVKGLDITTPSDYGLSNPPILLTLRLSGDSYTGSEQSIEILFFDTTTNEYTTVVTYLCSTLITDGILTTSPYIPQIGVSEYDSYQGYWGDLELTRDDIISSSHQWNTSNNGYYKVKLLDSYGDGWISNNMTVPLPDCLVVVNGLPIQELKCAEYETTSRSFYLDIQGTNDTPPSLPLNPTITITSPGYPSITDAIVTTSTPYIDFNVTDFDMPTAGHIHIINPDGDVVMINTNINNQVNRYQIPSSDNLALDEIYTYTLTLVDDNHNNINPNVSTSITFTYKEVIEIPIIAVNWDNLIFGPITLSHYEDAYNSDNYRWGNINSNQLPSNNITGSLKEYYNVISHGQLNLKLKFINASSNVVSTNPTIDNLAFNMGSDYLDDESAPFNINIKNRLSQALTYAKSTVDQDGSYIWKNSFNNKAVVFVHSGIGGETEGESHGDNTFIWSHKSQFANSDGENSNVVYSVNAGRYNNGVTKPTDGSNWITPINTIGVIVHETLHSFGLPDLYDIDGTSQGVGNASIMAGGSYGSNGYTSYLPGYADAWVREELNMAGLFSVNIIDIYETTTNIALPPITTIDKIYRVHHPRFPGDYWLIENRQSGAAVSSNSNYLPDYNINNNGLWIWRISSVVEDYAPNQHEIPWAYSQHWQILPNISTSIGKGGESGNRVAFQQVDGLFRLENNITRQVYSYQPGDEYSETTTPSSVSLHGIQSGIKIHNILQEADGSVTFDIEYTHGNTANQSRTQNIINDNNSVRIDNIHKRQISSKCNKPCRILPLEKPPEH